MNRLGHVAIALCALSAVAVVRESVLAQPNVPNPYRLVEGWPQLPASMNGGKFGEVIGVKPGPDGGIWVLHRCFNTVPAGNATCVGRDDMPPVLKFDPSGKLLESWGQGGSRFRMDSISIMRATSGRPTPTLQGRCSACRPAAAGIKSSS